jgi:hypothetical protein
MSKTIRFQSVLAEQMEQFVAFKRMQGMRVHQSGAHVELLR